MYSIPFNTPAYSDPATTRRPLPLAWFIGVPWVSGGRDPATGLDCWGIVLTVARECYGQVLPDYRGYEDADEMAETAPLFLAREAWQRIDAGAEREGDVVVLKLAGTPAHAGLVVGVGVMIHSMRGHNAAIDRYRSRLWADRIEGFYRWQPH